MAARTLLRHAPLRALRTIAAVLRIAIGSLVVFLILGNVVIAAAWQVHARTSNPDSPSIEGVAKLYAVDDRLWRSAAPSTRSYDELAAAGVSTIVDLRAEADLHVDVHALEGLGVQYVHMPIRDGQIPSVDQVDRLLGLVRNSDGVTLVHCGAGVGRTGAMVAAYRVATGQSTGSEAMQANLAVGPPSLEQLAFAAALDSGVRRPSDVVVGASRLLDAPRRLWSRYGL